VNVYEFWKVSDFKKKRGKRRKGQETYVLFLAHLRPLAESAAQAEGRLAQQTGNRPAHRMAWTMGCIYANFEGLFARRQGPGCGRCLLVLYAWSQTPMGEPSPSLSLFHFT
jgi:hypothetical protein